MLFNASHIKYDFSYVFWDSLYSFTKMFLNYDVKPSRLDVAGIPLFPRCKPLFDPTFPSLHSSLQYKSPGIPP